MPRWTEQDIAIFWEMKQEGASLIDIADRLGRDYKAVSNLAYNQKKKTKGRTKMNETINATEVTEVTEATAEKKPTKSIPEPAPSTKSTSLDTIARQQIEMILGLGLAFDNVVLNLSDRAAKLEFCFERREDKSC